MGELPTEVESLRNRRLEENKDIKGRQGGFTFAELLIALGILSILLSIGMVALVKYQRLLKLTEMDATARSIFVAAQNHITAAKASGEWEGLVHQYEGNEIDAYLGSNMEKKPSDYPAGETWPDGGNGDGHEYRYLVYNGEEDVLSNTILDIILPHGSLDEEIRREGCYVIEYDYETATVYGVFYTDSSKKFSYELDIMGESGLNDTMGREPTSQGKEVRKNYKNTNGSIIIGYYGGAVANDLYATKLEPIEIQVDNGDTLKVTIKDNNYGKVVDGVKVKTKISVTVTGEESQTSVTSVLDTNTRGINLWNVGEEWWTYEEENGCRSYTLTLDDVTRQGRHFADLFPSLIPGENITIEAEAFSDQVLCTPVKAQAYTNSLFAANYQYEEDGVDASKVTIGNVRHLQNLSPEVSNLPTEVSMGQGQFHPGRIVRKAEQIKSLNWDTFLSGATKKDIAIYSYEEIITQQKKLSEGKFYGITNLGLIEYEGNGHTISNFVLQADGNGNVGLFSQVGAEIVSQNLTVKNLVLDMFVSESNGGVGNAGTLVGQVTETGTFLGQNISVTNATVKAGSKGNSGGLIGKMSSGKLEQCSVYLTDGGNLSGNNKTAAEKYEMGAYDSEKQSSGTQFAIGSSGGVAGGLVGVMANTEITDSFASVPVVTTDNGVAGGLAGETTGHQSSITNSYTGGYTKSGYYSQFYGVSALGNNGVAGGFIGKDTAGVTTIKNCYSTISVYANVIGGFTGITENGVKTYRNCYATGKVEGVNDYSKKGPFIGEIREWDKVFAQQCYYLKESNKGLSSSVGGVEALEYEELGTATSAFGGRSSGNRSVNTKKNIESYSYDPTLKTVEYPFGLVTNTGAKEGDTHKVHYGDWPLKEVKSTEEIGVVYYEIIEDKLYYHGYLGEFSANESQPNYKEIMTAGKELTNGLVTEAGKYVSEDGYIILVPEGTDLTKIAVGFGSAKNYASERWTLSQCVKPLAKESLFSVEGFQAYYLEKQPNIYDISYITLGENTNQYYPEFGDYVSFYVNPYFADTVKKEKTEGDIFYIRSTRHLLNMNKLVWSNSNNQNTEFIQNLDISYENMIFTENGRETSYDYETMMVISASYTAKKYQSEHGERGYVIKGLKVPLFGSINQTSVVKGVTLVNSQVTGTESFATSNAGVIDSCVVRAEKPGNDGYSSVIVESQSNATGFVTTNSGRIINSYFIGTVTGNSVSGFVDTNYGTIESSYANVILTGNSSAAGFVRYNNNGTIKNSFSVGAVRATGDQGVAYGFMEESNGGSMENCYSSLFQLSAKQVYGFGKGRGSSYINCVWLNTNYIEGEVQEGNPVDLKEQGSPMAYEDMVKKGNHPNTFKYNSDYQHVDRTGDVYPFELKTTGNAYLPMEYWGDWPEQEVTLEAGLLYYQIIEGKLYYHGYLSRGNGEDGSPRYKEVMTPNYQNTNGFLENSENDQVEEGYMLLIPGDREDSTIHVQYEGSQQTQVQVSYEEVEQTIVEQLWGLEGFQAYYIKIGEIPENLYEGKSIIVEIGRNLGEKHSTPLEEPRVRFSFQPWFEDSVKPYHDV